MKLILILLVLSLIPLTSSSMQSSSNVNTMWLNTGVIGSSGVVIVQMIPANLSSVFIPPYTITLSFANNTNRVISLSSDGGKTYFTPSYDVSTGSGSTAGIFVVSVATPITHVQFTGSSGDVWSIL